MNKVKNPNAKHYELWHDFESIDIIKQALTQEEYQGFLKGNILKYQLRIGKKDNTKKEIEKIQDYRKELDSLLQTEESMRFKDKFETKEKMPIDKNTREILRKIFKKNISKELKRVKTLKGSELKIGHVVKAYGGEYSIVDIDCEDKMINAQLYSYKDRDGRYLTLHEESKIECI